MPTPGFYQATFLEVLMPYVAGSGPGLTFSQTWSITSTPVSFAGEGQRMVCTLFTAS